MMKAMYALSVLAVSASGAIASTMDFTDVTTTSSTTSTSPSSSLPVLNSGRGDTTGGTTPPTIPFDPPTSLDMPMIVLDGGRDPVLVALFEANATGTGGTPPSSGSGGSIPFDMTGLPDDADVPRASSMAPVPLPAGLPLLIAGLAGLGLFRRKRNPA